MASRPGNSRQYGNCASAFLRSCPCSFVMFCLLGLCRVILLMDWMKIEAPSLEDIEALARCCFADLPSAFRELAGDITFMVQDFPDDSVVEDMELESPLKFWGFSMGLISLRATRVMAPKRR